MYKQGKLSIKQRSRQTNSRHIEKEEKRQTVKSLNIGWTKENINENCLENYKEILLRLILLDKVPLEIILQGAKILTLTLIVLGEGGTIRPATQNFVKSALWSHNDNTALIKQISLFNTTLVMTNT